MYFFARGKSGQPSDRREKSLGSVDARAPSFFPSGARLRPIFPRPRPAKRDVSRPRNVRLASQQSGTSASAARGRSGAIFKTQSSVPEINPESPRPTRYAAQPNLRDSHDGFEERAGEGSLGVESTDFPSLSLFRLFPPLRRAEGPASSSSRWRGGNLTRSLARSLARALLGSFCRDVGALARPASAYGRARGGNFTLDVGQAVVGGRARE